MRLPYSVPFTKLTSDSQSIADLVDPRWLTWQATAYALRWKIQSLQGDDPHKMQMLGEALVQAEAKANQFKAKMGGMHRPHDHDHSIFAVPTGGVETESDV